MCHRCNALIKQRTFMLLQRLMTGAAFDLAGLLIVAAMSLVCFIPFGLHLRGVHM